ncbi:MAG: hypothetical protein WD887_00525, partial [Candidatus Saccharimonadales bacterium]
DVTSAFTTLNGSSTANGAGSAATSLILNDATNFDVGNYVKVDSTDCVSGVNSCYAKITAKASNTLTISPAITWADTSTVTEVHVPEVGGTNTASTLTNRYGRGYFIDGIATGNGSTYYTDNSITFGGGSKITDSSGKLQLQAGGATAGDGGNASIYFLSSAGTARARFDTTISTVTTTTLGDTTISSSTTINNTATTPAAGSNTPSTTMTVSSATGFSVGDQVLIAQVLGTGAGNFERKVISAINGNILTFTSATSNTYTQTAAGACSASSSSCAEVVKVWFYGNLTVASGGTLQPPTFSTSTGTGGLLVIHATSITVNSGGTITTFGKGLPGGTGATSANVAGGNGWGPGGGVGGGPNGSASGGSGG